MMLRDLVTVQSAPAELPSAPAKAVPRVYPGVPQRESSVELQRVSRPVSIPASDTTSPGSGLEDLEMSRPASPTVPADGGVEALPSIWDPYMNRYRFLATCLCYFTNGLSDSAPGALIPHMETCVPDTPTPSDSHSILTL